MNKPHKHAELIKQWADGAQIERYFEATDKWVHHKTPAWSESSVYRVKPKVKWTPEYTLVASEYLNDNQSYSDYNDISADVRNYWKLIKFVEEFEQDWDNQRYEVLIRDKGNEYTAVDRLPSRTLGTLRMSKECAEKLCKMLNNGEVEL